MLLLLFAVIVAVVAVVCVVYYCMRLLHFFGKPLHECLNVASILRHIPYECLNLPCGPHFHEGLLARILG